MFLDGTQIYHFNYAYTVWLHLNLIFVNHFLCILRRWSFLTYFPSHNKTFFSSVPPNMQRLTLTQRSWMDPQDFNTEEFQFPDKWDQDDNDFTALKNTMGFNLRPLGLMRRNYRKTWVETGEMTLLRCKIAYSCIC